MPPTGLDEHTRRLCERARQFEDDVDPYRRGIVATEVYPGEPDLPAVRKRAEVMARTLETFRPVVLPEERIVGAAYRRFRVHPGVGDPDAWRIRVLYPDRHGYDPGWPMPDEVREVLRWWKDRDVGLRARNEVRRRNRWLSRYAVAGPHGLVQGHTLPDHGILLGAGRGETGLGGDLPPERSDDRRGAAATVAWEDARRHAASPPTCPHVGAGRAPLAAGPISRPKWAG